MHRVPYTSTVSLFTSYLPSTPLDISFVLPPSLCLAPGWIRNLPLTTSFLFHLAQSVSVSHVSFCISLLLLPACLDIDLFSLSLLSSLLPFPFPLSLSLVRPRPPSRPIMLPYCLGILSLTPKPVQIASGFARTCMSAPLSVRRSLATRKGRNDVNLTGNNRKR